MKKMTLWIVKTSYVKTEDDGGPSRIDGDNQLYWTFESAEVGYEKKVQQIKDEIVKSLSKYHEYDLCYDEEDFKSFDNIRKLFKIYTREEGDYYFWFYMDESDDTWDLDGVLNGYAEVSCRIEQIEYCYEETDTIWNLHGSEVESSDTDEKEGK